MKERIEGLHHIGIPTKNMEATVDFYSSFGGEVIFEKEDTHEGKPIQVVLMKFMDTVFEFYEREQTTSNTGAIEHLAFSVNDIDGLYKIAKNIGYDFMQECVDRVQMSTYWPNSLRWFIVYGANGEKIEFCQSITV